jgi:EmrB/QacA subfamily drug resistance transporter
MSELIVQSGLIRKANPWWSLGIVCAGTLMTALDGTIVNVALPSIRGELDFSAVSLVWVVNAYLLTYAGFRLLSGRLGDLFGHAELFLLGIILFGIASIGCGTAHSRELLVGARAAQGIGSAVVSTSALALTMTLFQETRERAKAMGVYAFVVGGGQSIGLLAGGALTAALNWRWVFFVNIPIALLVYLLGTFILPRGQRRATGSGLDIGGAITSTASLTIAAYAIALGNEVGWTSFSTLFTAVTAILLMCLFVAIEKTVATPLVPLRLLGRRNLVLSGCAGALLSAAMLGWSLICTLYLQRVLGYAPMQVAVAFLASSATMGLFSLGLAGRIVTRFGTKLSLATGLTCVAIGLLLFVRAPLDGNEAIDILPGMIILGIGTALSWNPLFMAAMSDATASDSGLSSGITGTATMFGGALGLATLAGIAAAHTQALSDSGIDMREALNAGYHTAFALAALLAAVAIIPVTRLRIRSPQPAPTPAATGEAIAVDT